MCLNLRPRQIIFLSSSTSLLLKMPYQILVSHKYLPTTFTFPLLTKHIHFLDVKTVTPPIIPCLLWASHFCTGSCHRLTAIWILHPFPCPWVHTTYSHCGILQCIQSQQVVGLTSFFFNSLSP